MRTTKQFTAVGILLLIELSLAKYTLATSTEISGDATSSSFTFTGPVSISTLSVTNALTIPNGSAASDAASFGQIQVFQFVQNTSTTATSTTSSTFQACTNQTVTITPMSNTHRIKVTVTTTLASGSSSTQALLTLKRGSTELSGVISGFALGDWAINGAVATVSFTYIDSPATTISTTYQVYLRSQNNSSQVTSGRTDVKSVFIAEEIQ